MSKNIKSKELLVQCDEGTFGRVRRMGSGLVETERYEFIDTGSRKEGCTIRKIMTEVEARAWASAILGILE